MEAIELVSGVTYWLGAFSGGGGEVKVLIKEHVQMRLFNLSSLCWQSLTHVNNLLSETSTLSTLSRRFHLLFGLIAFLTREARVTSRKQTLTDVN